MTQREAEVILKVNSKEAQEKLGRLEAQAVDLRDRFAEAFRQGDTRGIDTINKQLLKVNKEIDNMRTNAANIRAAMVRLNEASPRELQRTIKLINNELNSGRVKRGTKEWDEYVNKLKEVQTELRKVKEEMAPDDGESFIDRIKNGITDWGATAATAAAAFAGVTMAAKSAVKAYADMEAEQANVRKYTGMTADEVRRLNEEFKGINTRTSREDLNKLAQEAGRLGKTSLQDVLGFVRAADQINVALDDLGEGATLTLSKLTGIFGDEKRYGTEQSLLKVGSVVNELSQNCSASAPYLAEFSSRLGGIAAQSKMSISQVMAFAAVLDTQNLAVEASSTAVGQLITKIYQEPAKIAIAAGLDVKKFSDMVKTDMNGALIMLFEHLNQFGGMESLAYIFDRMGTDGARAIPVMSALAGHVEELKGQQEEANNAFREGISVTNEFSVQNNTVQAQLDKAKKGFNEMAVSLGEQLLPVMRGCVSGVSLLMRVMSNLVSFIVQHRTVILSLVAAITAYTIAVNLAIVKQALWSAALIAWRTITITCTAATKLMAVAVALMTGNVQKARAAWIAFSSALRLSPVGLLVSAVAGVVVLLGSFAAKASKATTEADRLAKAQKKIADAEKDAVASCAVELTQLEALYNATQDQTLAMEQRIAAVRSLQEKYPDYFKNMATEAILAGNAADAYERLRSNIVRSAQAQARKDLLAETEKKILEIERDRDRRVNEIVSSAPEQGSIVRDRDYKFLDNRSYIEAAPTEFIRRTAIHAIEEEAAEKLAELRKERELLYDGVARDVLEDATLQTPTPTPTPTPQLPETEKEQREREKKEREAREAAKKALQDDLNERKSLYLQAVAENLSMYVIGKRNYVDYLAQKEQLEKDYVDDVIKIHEDHNKLDLDGYRQALNSKAGLFEAQLVSERKLDADHKATSDALTSAFFDASSPEFQNKILLNQMLFQEDIRYLTAKRDLYKKNSERWADLDRQINERTKQDQLDKHKEFLDKLNNIKSLRGDNNTVTAVYRAQTEALKRLFEQNEIDAEQYYKFLATLEADYEKKLKKSSPEIGGDWKNMVELIHDAFTDLFKTIAKGGASTEVVIARISTAVQASVALMSAVASQYSTYVNAERDLELAKTEKRYDKEIAAAGKNTKKKERLEKQKEADIAKIKKKYNDKAMKIELAQAIASTAQATIAAYASAAAIPKIGWIMAPIAAGLATAAGMMQVATIKKQHEAEAAGYYDGGFTSRDANNRREVGVVHANEFVANHQAVANPALAPVLRLIDTAQRNNTIGSLTAADVSNAIGQGVGVSARGDVSRAASYDSALIGGLSAMTQTNIAANEVMTRLSDALVDGIEAKVILDGEDGFHKKYTHFQRLLNNPKR